MHALICDVISYCTWSFDIDIISVNDKILTENLRKAKRWKSKKLCVIFLSKWWSTSALHSLPRQTEGRKDRQYHYTLWPMLQLHGSRTVIDVNWVVIGIFIPADDNIPRWLKKYPTGQNAFCWQPCEIFVPEFFHLYKRDLDTIIDFYKNTLF